MVIGSSCDSKDNGVARLIYQILTSRLSELTERGQGLGHTALNESAKG
jgi:hypothetical protein